MQNKARLEFIVCVVLILLGVAAFFSIGLSEGTASKFLLRQERSMGAMDYQSLPKIYSIALIILCLANIGLSQFKNRREKTKSAASDLRPVSQQKSGPAKTVITRTWGTALLLIAYAGVMPHVPFFLSTAVFLFLLFVLYGKTNLRIVVPLTLAGTVFFWGVFIKIASLPIGKI